MPENPLIYMAGPYTHLSYHIREKRFKDLCWTAAQLIKSGLMIYSPISHSHPILEIGQLPVSFDYWKEFDEHMISLSSRVIVITLDGWKESRGVTSEISFSVRNQKVVEFYSLSSDNKIEKHSADWVIENFINRLECYA